jgi:type II secretory pathway component GspD/PulD (secretin)
MVSAQDDTAQYASLIQQQAQENALIPRSAIPNATISLDLRDIEIIDALKFLATKAGMNIIPTKKVSGRITLMVENTSAKDVFDIILRSNSLAYDKKGDIYNVMTEDEYKALYGRKFSDMRQVKIIRLKYMVPDQALTFIDTLKSEIGKILLDSESGTLLLMDTPEKLREIEDALFAMEEKSAVKIFNLKYALAKNIEEQLKKQLDVKKVGTIRADERTNQVIVQTLPERMDEISKLIEGLDKKTKQILIDAKIIQIKLSDDLSQGIEWEGLFNVGKKYGMTYLGSYPFSSVDTTSADWRSRKEVLEDVGYVGSYPFSGTTSNFSSSTKKTALQNLHIGVVGKNDFDLLINYFQTLGDTKILSNPKLAVINNQEAKIHVGERQAYITTTTTQGQGTTTTSEAVTFLDVGIQLFVTPFINDEGYVTVKIKPEISSVLDYLETGSHNKIPIIETSTAETTVMVKDNTTLIIGGLSKSEETKDSDSTPMLSKVPLVGKLFGTKADKTVRTEILVMLTPHIISGDELTTGYDRDFGARLDKESQEYQPFTEKGEGAEYKLYQNYPQMSKEEPKQPSIKPMQEIK